MGKNIKPLIIWLVFGAAGIIIFLSYFGKIFPVAPVDLKLDKKEVLRRAELFFAKEKFNLQGFEKTIIFSSNDSVLAYLQKNDYQRADKYKFPSSSLSNKDVAICFWHIRWFKELEKEGYAADVDPASGDVLNFRHFLLDDSPGADLSSKNAKVIAQNMISSAGFNLADYRLKESASEKRNHRTDHYFEWERKYYRVKNAALRLAVDVYGDKVGRFKRYLYIPEEFWRSFNKETSWGAALAVSSQIAMFILTVAAVFLLGFKVKNLCFDWMPGVLLSAIVGVLSLFSFFNGLPLIWNSYPDTISKVLFFMNALSGAVVSTIGLVMFIFAYVTLGEALSRDKLTVYRAFKDKKIEFSRITPVFIVGYSLAFIFLGYITLFYLGAKNFFGAWIVPDTSYSNALATFLPFISVLTISLVAAIGEEAAYRLFAFTFLKAFTKCTLLAIFLSALFWGFAHSTYAFFPVYLRGIELTIFGSIFVLVFLRYGFETVVLAHFVIDAVIVGMPLMRSHNFYFIISGVFVIFLPLIIFYCVKNNYCPLMRIKKESAGI